MIKIGTVSISALYNGSEEILSAYNGSDLVFQKEKFDPFPYLVSQGGFIKNGSVLNKYEITFDSNGTITYFTPTKEGYEWMCYVYCKKVLSGNPSVYIYMPGGISGNELKEGKEFGTGSYSPMSSITVKSEGSGSATITIEAYYYK